MKKIWFVVWIVLICLCFMGGRVYGNYLQKKEIIDYIEWLGDKAMDMTIGGDADAYRTLEWAKDQENITKEKLEQHYKSYEEKRFSYRVCWGQSTEEYEWICNGYWYTFTRDGEIYNCLPQIDGGKMWDDNICYDGKRYSCYVNLGEITEMKISKSCEENKEIEKMMQDQEQTYQSCINSGGFLGRMSGTYGDTKNFRRANIICKWLNKKIK